MLRIINLKISTKYKKRWIYPEGLTEMSGSLFFIQGSIFSGMVHAPSHIEYKKKYCKV